MNRPDYTVPDSVGFSTAITPTEKPGFNRAMDEMARGYDRGQPPSRNPAQAPAAELPLATMPGTTPWHVAISGQQPQPTTLRDARPPMIPGTVTDPLKAFWAAITPGAGKPR